MENIIHELTMNYRDLFPNGYIHGRISTQLGSCIYLTIGLIERLDDVSNKIRENDPLIHKFVIHIEKDGSYTAELAHGGLMVDPVEKFYAMSRVKTNWRKVAGDETKVIKGFTKWFNKLRGIVDENKDKIYNRHMYQNYI